jgi:hypothetical protein
LWHFEDKEMEREREREKKGKKLFRERIITPKLSHIPEYV